MSNQHVSEITASSGDKDFQAHRGGVRAIVLVPGIGIRTSKARFRVISISVFPLVGLRAGNDSQASPYLCSGGRIVLEVAAV
jgi:hypothetical protein